nr:paraneoplastic antigen Ma6E-like [Aegilops tauschii subsp. strangulata]
MDLAGDEGGEAAGAPARGSGDGGDEIRRLGAAEVQIWPREAAAAGWRSLERRGGQRSGGRRREGGQCGQGGAERAGSGGRAGALRRRGGAGEGGGSGEARCGGGKAARAGRVRGAPGAAQAGAGAGDGDRAPRACSGPRGPAAAEGAVRTAGDTCRGVIGCGHGWTCPARERTYPAARGERG